jgi:hypothetical protein
MLAVAGVTAMEESVFAAAVTVRAAVPFIPLNDAVTVLDPAATPDAIPAALIFAAAALELVHATVDVTFAVEPSVYVAVAVNCCAAPAAMLAVAGVTAMEVTEFWLPVNEPPLHPMLATANDSKTENRRRADTLTFNRFLRIGQTESTALYRSS